MTLGRRGIVCVNLLFFLLLAAPGSSAAEQSGAVDRASEIFKWINFAIVIAAVAWVFLKVTPPFFRKNAEGISAAIADATAAKAEAERQLREAEGRIARLEQEVAQLRAEAQREAAAEAARIRNLAKSDAERIAAAGKTEIEAAERAARMELKVIAAKLAVDGAESLLTRQMTPQTQESLVASFVKSLESRRN